MKRKMRLSAVGMLHLFRQWRACLLCGFVCIGALQFGYDSSYFSGVLVITPFLEQFGHFDVSSSTYVLSASMQSLVTSIINSGEFFGAISASLIGDAIGRKKGMYISNAAVVVGTLFQVTFTHISTLIVGRWFVGYAIGLISCLVPLYIADCAPANLRGAMGALYQQFIGFGLLFGIVMTKLFANRVDSGAYRIPMALQLVFPALLIPALLFFVPESPRWLLEKGRAREAKRSLARIHGGSSNDIDYNFITIDNGLRNHCNVKSSWAHIYRKSCDRRKACLVMVLSAFQQLSGINFITSYGVSFFKDLGFDNAFNIQLGLYLIGWPAIWISQVLMERYGRRLVLIKSGILMVICLFTIGTCGVMKDKYGLNSKNLSSTIVVMVYFYLFVYNLGWGPTVWVYTSEISTGRNRGRLMSLGASCNWLFAWLVVFTYPYITNNDAGNLGPSVGFLYGASVLCGCVWVYLFLPETKNKTLEEIYVMFEEDRTVGGFAQETGASERLENSAEVALHINQSTTSPPKSSVSKSETNVVGVSSLQVP